MEQTKRLSGAETGRTTSAPKSLRFRRWCHRVRRDINSFTFLTL